MRDIPLTVIKGGINRLRVKGGARPDSLYDALNCHVTAAQTVIVRAGTVRQNALPSGTKGLCAFEDKLHVFADSVIAVSDPYVLHVLAHPTDATQTLKEIHFSEPFLGFLYVVAEFTNGDVFHYWLQSSGPWQANHIYHAGDLVEPTTPNGLAYKATRIGAPFPSWAPNVPRNIASTGVAASIIEPTVYNDFFYTAIAVSGDNPASGTIEPTWPTSEGATVVEETDTITAGSPTATPAPPNNTVGQGTIDRYGNGV
jgi:hypothetical protein